MKVRIETTYTITASSDIELPEGKTWADVEDWFVKWSELHIQFTDEKDYRSFEMQNDPSFDSIDWKYPNQAKLYGDNDDAELLDERE